MLATLAFKYFAIYYLFKFLFIFCDTYPTFGVSFNLSLKINVCLLFNEILHIFWHLLFRKSRSQIAAI